MSTSLNIDAFQFCCRMKHWILAFKFQRASGRSADKTSLLMTLPLVAGWLLGVIVIVSESADASWQDLELIVRQQARRIYLSTLPENTAACACMVWKQSYACMAEVRDSQSVARN